MPMLTVKTEPNQDLLDSVTEEEIIRVLRLNPKRGLSEEQAWQAVVTGIALHMAFDRSKSIIELDH